MAQEEWRVFCSVDLTVTAREAAAAYLARLRRYAPPQARIGWERPEKLHIALNFLGEIEVARVAAVKQAATRAAYAGTGFTLSLQGAGVFPPRGAPRVFWLGVQDASGGLAALQRRLAEECAASGFPRETRVYRPHVTLARMRTPVGAHELARHHQTLAFAPVTFDVREMLVVRSELGPGGSRYMTLGHYPLSAA